MAWRTLSDILPGMRTSGVDEPADSDSPEHVHERVADLTGAAERRDGVEPFFSPPGTQRHRKFFAKEGLLS